MRNLTLRKADTVLLLVTLGIMCLFLSCAPTLRKGKLPTIVVEAPALIQSIRVIPLPSAGQTSIEIASSKRAPYTAFKLVQPLCLIVDITAVPVEGVSEPDVTEDRIIEAIWFGRMKDKLPGTRVIAGLSQDVTYDIEEEDGTIKVLLFAKEPVEKVEAPVLVTKKEEVEPREPRLFFSPRKIKLNQVLGIDFFMLPEGKSRIIVTTSKRAEIELSRKNSLTLLLHVKGATIPRELARYIDSSYFKGAVNQITPTVEVAEKRVDLEIELKEMVPYHLMQTDTEIHLDFNKTSVEPPAKKITPTRLREAIIG